MDRLQLWLWSAGHIHQPLHCLQTQHAQSALQWLRQSAAPEKYRFQVGSPTSPAASPLLEGERIPAELALLVGFESKEMRVNKGVTSVGSNNTPWPHAGHDSRKKHHLLSPLILFIHSFIYQILQPLNVISLLSLGCAWLLFIAVGSLFVAGLQDTRY